MQLFRGSVIIKQAKKFGVTQEELARLLRASCPTFVKIEKEKRQEFYCLKDVVREL